MERQHPHTPLSLLPLPWLELGVWSRWWRWGGTGRRALFAWLTDPRTRPECACSSESKGHCVLGAEVQTEEWEV